MHYYGFFNFKLLCTEMMTAEPKILPRKLSTIWKFNTHTVDNELAHKHTAIVAVLLEKSLLAIFKVRKPVFLFLYSLLVLSYLQANRLGCHYNKNSYATEQSYLGGCDKKLSNSKILVMVQIMQ
jgi:hypothetical protein